MQKDYEFWLLPYNEFHQSPEQPYSGIHGTLNTVKNWCEELFWTNHNATAIQYKSVGGRITHTMERDNLPSFYNPEVKG